MHKRGLKFTHVVDLVKLNFTYITVVKQPKLGLNLIIDPLEHPSVHINHSSPCIVLFNHYNCRTIFGKSNNRSSKRTTHTGI